MNPNLVPASIAGMFSVSPSKPKSARSHSRLAAYVVFFSALLASMAAAATVAISELPLLLGGM